MPKLLQINIVANWGSTGRIAEEIGQLAISKGWESYIAYGRGKPQSQSQLIRVGSNLDMYSHVIQSRLLDNHGLASKKATERLIQKIVDISPDIIHLHNIHGYYLNYPTLFSFLNKANIPVIWTFHDCWPFTGHCAYFDFVNCNKWKEQCHSCEALNTYPVSIFDASSRNYALKKQYLTQVPQMVLVPVSHWLDGLIHESLLSHYDSKVVHNGINTELFLPTFDDSIRDKYKLGNRFIILGLTNIWAARKGLNDILKLNDIIDHSIYQIVLVGLNEKQMKQIPDSIIGIPRTDSLDDLVKLYSLAGVFINPTWEDNFPTTNLEALSCGTPVITYQTGGSPEAIDEKTGYVVPKGDVNALYEAVGKVYEGNIKRDDCRKRAINLYDKNSCYAKYIDLYNSLL